MNTRGKTILSIVVVHASTTVQRKHAKSTLASVHAPATSPHSSPTKSTIEENIAAEPSKLFRVPGICAGCGPNFPQLPIASPTPVAMRPAAPESSGIAAVTASESEIAPFLRCKTRHR